ncbi:tetratricopeptide repeat protein [Aureimonas leprariae]|uniref:Tetratricopeptide repeat protein n=1 Tax=Plantimonas leprariae TaxID=2615207 RepID=A0A7V7PL22_9HYPH|nr:tetratricopeptide repeat protein [Aureimonas leprariae]KAB0676859.1 tetratricopeptide repeat protein [Aureimonas leprariae]
MSILNSRFTDRETLQDAHAFAAQLVDGAFEHAELDERQKSIVELMGEGLSLADIFGITKDELDALVNQACLFIQAGDTAKARDVLTKLAQLEPTDERGSYLLGTTFQMEGDLERAVFFYTRFLALDATNPEGYLRLGECLMTAGERNEATAAFRTALDFAREGKGRPGNAEHAEQMLGLLAA